MVDGEDVARGVKRAARQTNDHPVVEQGARLGYAASGVLHLLLGFVAAGIALGKTSDTADQSGAFGLLAEQWWGKVVLALIAIGCLLLALLHLTQVVIGKDGDTGLEERAKSAGTMIVYGAIAFTAAKFTFGQRSSSKQQSTSMTASLLDSWWGRALVIIAAIVIIAIGAYHVMKGWTKNFVEDDLAEHPGATAVVIGRIGYIAKGIALVIVGLLVGAAGVRKRASDAGGLDTALRSLRDLPLGTVLLLAVALGLIAYGVYSLVRARYARL